MVILLPPVILVTLVTMVTLVKDPYNHTVLKAHDDTYSRIRRERKYKYKDKDNDKYDAKGQIYRQNT